MCVLLLRPEGKSFKQVGSGAHSEVPAQPLLPGSEPQGLGQEMGVGEPGSGVDFPRPGDLQGRPHTPVAVAMSFMGFPFKSLQASCPCAPQGCAKLGP